MVVEVEEEGDGIPPDQIDHIFDKFHRAPKENRVRSGTGLGLGICRGFIEAVGGGIIAGNRADGRCAVFTVTLPAASLTMGHAA